MQNNSKISIIVTYLSISDPEIWHMTDECIRKIRTNTFNDFELIFAMNGQTTHTYPVDIIVWNKENMGNAVLWDQGVSAANNNIVVLMDNDVWVEKNWDKEMVEKLSDSQIGITFPYSKRGNLVEDYEGRKDGFLFAFRKETYDEAGPFLQDQPFKLGYYEDDNFEANVQYKLGLKLVACPTSLVWHKGQGTTKKMWSQEVEDGIEANKRWYESIWGQKYPYLEN